jgi:hypothetical protein
MEMNRYIIIMTGWFLGSIITLMMFRFIPRKMKMVEDKETKNSLYTILIFLGVPMLMAAILTPAVFIIGDAGMDSVYKIVWGGLCLLFIIYYFFVNRSKKNIIDKSG